MARSDTGLPNSCKSGSLWHMTGHVPVVTFIGAGGKTTCVRSMTQEIDAAGYRVIATTTTKVFPEEAMKGWRSPNPPPYEHVGACFWYAQVEDSSGKWIGPPVQAVDAAIARARNIPDLHWVIEGDGAKGLKLKCWEPHEPQIPQQTDCAVLVLDGGLWGNVLLAEHVHRPAGCLELLGHLWNAESAWRYFLKSPVFAPLYGQMSWVILLNRHGGSAENKDLLETGETLQTLFDLKHRWGEIRQEVKTLNHLPSSLRIAVGDAKEGELQWFDLW